LALPKTPLGTAESNPGFLGMALLADLLVMGGSIVKCFGPTQRLAAPYSSLACRHWSVKLAN
jgi:hypothetical protein